MGETVKFREREDVETIFRGWAALIPQPAVRSGWNLRNAGLNHAVFEPSVIERWSVELVGPVDVDIRRHEFVGGRSIQTLHVRSDYIDTIEADTPEEVALLIQDWVKGASLDKIKD